MASGQGITTVLKRDALGSVERFEHADASYVRRVACGGRIPGSRLVARVLLGRERRALEALAGLAHVPRLIAGDPGLERRPAGNGERRRGTVLVRSFIEGEPLHRAETLPADFFDHLDQLVQSLHARGVCHNDLHKEQNVVVTRRGHPALIDFQLASVHADPRARAFRVRAAEDLRHVQKHRRRYTRDGRGPESAAVEHGAAYGARRSTLALIWRRCGKPVYNFVTRRVLRTRDGEERRPSTGPWPEWVAPLGPHPGGAPVATGTSGGREGTPPPGRPPAPCIDPRRT